MPSEDQPLSLLARKGWRLMVWCRTCHRRASLDPEPLIEKFGYSYPIPRMKHHLKCQACGGRRPSVYW